MSTIVLKSGFSWDNLPEAELSPVIQVAYLLAKLAELREQWQAATGGNLDQVALNLGLLLDDIEALCKGEA